jgi:hypothetical protein
MFLSLLSPSWEIQVKDSEVREDVSHGSTSSVIGIGVMGKTPGISSSSYMVIRSMRTSSTYIPLDVLVPPSCVVVAVGDLSCCDIIHGFSG